MKMKRHLQIIILSLLLMLVPFAADAAEAKNEFPFTFDLSLAKVDKLSYAGHILGGGMFYDDGFMITPDAVFTVGNKVGIEEDSYQNLTMEIDLIYENQDNTGCVKEVIKKFESGDIKYGKEYPVLPETTRKNLKQRKKLYSTDVMSVKVVMNYNVTGTVQKKQVIYLYVAKPEEYNEKFTSLTAPPQ